MLEPARVAECVAAMRAAVRIPVTVKMRIGVVSARAARAARAVAHFDEHDYDAPAATSRPRAAQAGCGHFIVHARKAVLGGLSPRENRESAAVALRRRAAPEGRASRQLSIVVNGGLRTARAVLEALDWCDGVMLGREAYHRPVVLAELQRRCSTMVGAAPTRAALLERMAAYAEREVAAGERLAAITRHMLGLYAGQPGARRLSAVRCRSERAPAPAPGRWRTAPLSAAGLRACGGHGVRGIT